MSWRFSAAQPVSVTARFWRMLAPRWAHQPLSGAGAARAGGRWNEPGQPALYMSDSQATAIAEYQQDLARPGTLAAYDVQSSDILNLADVVVQNALGIDRYFLRQPWKQIRDIARARPPAWEFARAAQLAGWHGLIAPSVQAPGNNLVLWRWNENSAPVVRVFDPLNDLPPNLGAFKS